MLEKTTKIFLPSLKKPIHSLKKNMTLVKYNRIFGNDSLIYIITVLKMNNNFNWSESCFCRQNFNYINQMISETSEFW